MLEMTLSRYTHTLTGDLVEALANLPAPPSMESQTTTAALVATGTDDVKQLAPQLAPESDSSCRSVTSDSTTGTEDNANPDARKSLKISEVDCDRRDMSSCGTEYAREDSNPQPADPKSAALSN